MVKTELHKRQTFKDDGELMTITSIFERDVASNVVLATDTYGCDWEYSECEILDALKLPSQDIMDIY